MSGASTQVTAVLLAVLLPLGTARADPGDDLLLFPEYRLEYEPSEVVDHFGGGGV